MVATPRVDAPHRSAESVACRLELDDPVASLGAAPVMGETKQVKRPGPLLAAGTVHRHRRWTEGDQSGLVGMDRQAVLAKPLRQNFHHALRIVVIVKPNDEVIRVADQT